MRRPFIVFFVALAALGMIGVASSRASQADASADSVVSQLQADENAIVQALAQTEAHHGQVAPRGLLDRTRYEFDQGSVDYEFRKAVRAERSDIYRLAADPDLTARVTSKAPPSWGASVADSAAALQALWRLDGQTDPSHALPHSHPGSTEPSDTLLGYYQEAGRRYHVEWTYLAAINFIESDFGRTPGPSPSGAEGPMQFLPSTWKEFGAGDIMSAHDSILAAARFLSHFTAVFGGDQAKAVWEYNHSQEYVAAVAAYASSMRRNASWLDRYYCWYSVG